MTVMDASTPDEAPSEGTPYPWLPTTQIGGDTVYGVPGRVLSAEDTSRLVGQSVGDGVVARVKAKEGTKCRGAVNGNEPAIVVGLLGRRLRNLGIEHLKFGHAGRSNPQRTIVLASEIHNLTLRNGMGCCWWGLNSGLSRPT